LAGSEREVITVVAGMGEHNDGRYGTGVFRGSSVGFS
jgi:hypothetical protein